MIGIDRQSYASPRRVVSGDCSRSPQSRNLWTGPTPWSRRSGTRESSLPRHQARGDAQELRGAFIHVVLHAEDGGVPLDGAVLLTDQDWSGRSECAFVRSKLAPSRRAFISLRAVLRRRWMLSSSSTPRLVPWVSLGTLLMKKNTQDLQQSQSTGCYPWRLGVPRYSTHLGTKHHPVL